MIFTKNFKNYLALNDGLNHPNRYLVKQTTFDGFVRYAPRSNTPLAYWFSPQVNNSMHKKQQDLPSPGTSSPASCSSSSSYAGGLRLGTGTTAPTENDITLETPLSGLSYSTNLERYFSISNGTAHHILKLTLSNIGSSAFSFREIGIFHEIVSNYPSTYDGPSGGSSYPAHYPVLMSRHVFDSSITLAASESIELVFDYKFPVDSTIFPDASQQVVPS